MKQTTTVLQQMHHQPSVELAKNVVSEKMALFKNKRYMIVEMTDVTFQNLSYFLKPA